MRRFAALLLRDSRGAVAIEFAILGPTMLALLFGVFQVGMGMQSYNALRSIAVDSARYAAIQYQTRHTLTNDEISLWTRGRAVNAPYLLSEGNILVTTITAPTQRVTGASERTLTIRYTMPTVLSVIGVDSFYISYSRPIFVPV